MAKALGTTKRSAAKTETEAPLAPSGPDSVSAEDVSLADKPVPMGYLAKKYCDVDLPVQVLRSGGGYYLGTTDEDGMPCSRESGYYPSQKAAEAALEANDWEQRRNP